MIRNRAALLAAVAGVALAAPAAAQREHGKVTVAPYIEVGQLLDADLSGGDTVTYTSVAAGIDLAADTSRASAQLSYRYDRRFGWGKDLGDDDAHTGLARAALRLVPGVSVEAGGLATRTRSDIRGAAPGLLLADSRNVSQLYTLFAGPSLGTTVGPLSVGADYRIGYTKVETPGSGGGLVAGQPRLDYYDDSLGNVVTARVGVAPGSVLPVGLTLSGGYEREDASQLDQRYEDAFGRVDALLPVSATVALQGGVGYEKLVTSSRSPVVDATTGAPVVDRDGRFVTDRSTPRRVDYRTDGVYFDAGVVWRPNRRTSVAAAVGRRYGTTIYTGQATWAASKTVGVAVNLYDSVETFGHQLRDNVGALPTSFITSRDLYSQQFNGCVFGTSGAAPGACLNSTLQSITTASYRTRGLDAIVSATRGLSTYGVGAGYANRKLFSRSNPGVSLYGLEDESYYAQAFFARTLSPVSTVDVNAILNYYDPASPLSDGVWSYGATGSYNHEFGRISTTASVGLYSFKVGDFDSDVSAQAQLAARYTF
jgi:hypothetical protein